MQKYRFPVFWSRILVFCALLGQTLDGWENRWVKSDWKKDENLAGEWNYTSGKWNGDDDDKGKLDYLSKTIIVRLVWCFQILV